MTYRHGSISSAMFWMFVLSILLFWMPVLGPLIAGFVGGRKAGSVGNAVIAVILPALIVGAALFFFASMLTLFPPIGLIAGFGGAVVWLAHAGPLLVGAVIGALV